MAAPAPTYFAIFSAMRSGSNLLEKSLEQYDGIEVHGELFNPSFIGKAGVESYCGITLGDREKQPIRLIEAICGGSGDSMPGFRIFDGHDVRIEQECLADPACAKVILQRDPVDSYVSLKAARETNQWMLRPAAKRKSARITFDPEEFSRYLDAGRSYFKRLRRHLQISGQTAFLLTYDDLQNREILDGLARYLGALGARREEKISIRRQNPESLSDRVENFAQMRNALDALGLSADALPFDGEPHRGPSIGRMIACRNQPFLTAVIPGDFSRMLLNWMRAVALARDAKDALLRPENQKELNRWFSRNRGAVCLIVTRHPLERAHDVFMRRVFSGGYPAIRRRLQSHFGLELPDLGSLPAPPDALAATGYDIARHRKAFAGFLEFVRANLAGQTGVRTDAEWASQISHLEGFNSIIPAARVVRQPDLFAELAHIAQSFGLPELTVNEDNDDEPGPFMLADIYDKNIEKLGRKAYAKDYLKLGYGDWSPRD